MKPPINPLQPEHISAFLEKHWQKKPLLIKQAIPDFISPLSPDELAGLACEEDVNARLVIEHPNASAEQTPWSVEYGPFDESRFSELPDTHWSLLVSDVERHLPETRDIIEKFRFIPDWRIDDLMISYAPEHGSVGPHTDAYDVFLLQIHGQRQWQISSNYDKQLLSNTELSILENFSSEQQWILNPGDILYLPPNIAHHGIALDGCMTASIGFRAPAIHAMVHDYADSIASQLDATSLYADPDLKAQSHPAEISADAIEKIRNILVDKLRVDTHSVQRWLGEYSSDGKTSLADNSNPPCHHFSELKKQFTSHDCYQNPESKFLFSRTADTTLLFVDGASYNVTQDFAETLCNHKINTEQLIKHSDEKSQKILMDLYRQGALLIERRDEYQQ